VTQRSWAEETQRVIDTELARLLRQAEERAVDLFTAHRAELDRLTELLLDQETVDGDAVHGLVGRQRPGSASGRAPVLRPGPHGRMRSQEATSAIPRGCRGP